MLGGGEERRKSGEKRRGGRRSRMRDKAVFTPRTRPVGSIYLGGEGKAERKKGGKGGEGLTKGCPPSRPLGMGEREERKHEGGKKRKREKDGLFGFPLCRFAAIDRKWTGRGEKEEICGEGKKEKGAKKTEGRTHLSQQPQRMSRTISLFCPHRRDQGKKGEKECEKRKRKKKGRGEEGSSAANREPLFHQQPTLLNEEDRKEGKKAGKGKKKKGRNLMSRPSCKTCRPRAVGGESRGGGREECLCPSRQKEEVRKRLEGKGERRGSTGPACFSLLFVIIVQRRRGRGRRKFAGGKRK